MRSAIVGELRAQREFLASGERVLGLPRRRGARASSRGASTTMGTCEMLSMEARDFVGVAVRHVDPAGLGARPVGSQERITRSTRTGTTISQCSRIEEVTRR